MAAQRRQETSPRAASTGMSPDSAPVAWFDPLPSGHDGIGRLQLFAGNLAALLPLLAIGLALGLLIVFVLLPRRTAYLLALIVAIAASILLINPHLVTYSYHGMVHLGYIYATLRPPWPPEDPFMAGTPLSYPWAFHALVGRISALLEVSPAWVHAAANLAALAATAAAVAAL